MCAFFFYTSQDNDGVQKAKPTVTKYLYVYTFNFVSISQHISFNPYFKFAYIVSDKHVVSFFFVFCVGP